MTLGGGGVIASKLEWQNHGGDSHVVRVEAPKIALLYLKPKMQDCIGTGTLEPKLPSYKYSLILRASSSHSVLYCVALIVITHFAVTLFLLTGTCINNTSVMMFKKGSFEIGATVYPVAIKVRNSHSSAKHPEIC